MRVRILLAILAVVALSALLVRVPLLAVPSYEPALAVGALAALATAWLAARRARTRPPQVTLRWGLLDISPGEAVLLETRANALAGAALVLAPLAILATEAMRSGCRLGAGPGTYLFIAAPAAYAGASIGTLVGSVTRSAFRATALTAFIACALALTTLGEFLSGPRTIVNNLVLGPISASGYTGYDTGLAFPPSAYLHRAFAVLAWTAVLLLAAAWRTRVDAIPGAFARAVGEGDPPADPLVSSWAASRADDAQRARFLLAHHRRAILRALAIVGLAALPFLAFPGASGLLAGRGPLRDALSGTVETEHFRIHFAPGSAAEPYLARLGVELEWDREQVRQWLGVAPPWKVDAWIHPDAATMYRLTGARGYLFASPWHHEFHAIAIHGRVPAMRHELIHVLVADDGAWPFRASLSMGLTEGLATALDEGLSRTADAHEEVAAASRAGELPSAQQVVSLAGFASGNMDRAYRSAASFVGWLLLTRGPEPLRRAYAMADFERAYGTSLKDLDAQWSTFLRDEVPVTASAAAEGRERFDPVKRPAFHATPCARLGLATEPPGARARLLSAEGFASDAAELWCETGRSHGDPDALETAASMRLQLGDALGALALTDAALRLVEPGSTARDRLLRRRFRLLGRIGRWEDARQAGAEWLHAGLSPWPDESALEVAEVSDVATRDAFFAAALETAPRDTAILSCVVESSPRAPAPLALLLSRNPVDRPVRPSDAARVEELAEVAPGPFAAGHVLALAQLREDDLDWRESARLCTLAASLPGLQPTQRLEAADGVGRAAWAAQVRWVSGPPMAPRQRCGAE